MVILDMTHMNFSGLYFPEECTIMSCYFLLQLLQYVIGYKRKNVDEKVATVWHDRWIAVKTKEF